MACGQEVGVECPCLPGELEILLNIPESVARWFSSCCFPGMTRADKAGNGPVLLMSLSLLRPTINDFSQ